MEHPIQFKTEMVRAILDGSKTQTRRVIKPQPEADRYLKSSDTYEWKFAETIFNGVSLAKSKWIKCPYGEPGDLLWVRETWAKNDVYPIRDREPGDYVYKADRNKLGVEKYAASWKPSIHMPKAAARIWLEVNDVRVERVQDISARDIYAEGLPFSPHLQTGRLRTEAGRGFPDFWDSMYAQRGYSWESNPWVWVISFRKM